MSEMPCVGACAPSGTRTTNRLITGQECEPLHLGTHPALVQNMLRLEYTGNASTA